MSLHNLPISCYFTLCVLSPWVQEQTPHPSTLVSKMDLPSNLLPLPPPPPLVRPRSSQTANPPFDIPQLLPRLRQHAAYTVQPAILNQASSSSSLLGGSTAFDFGHVVVGVGVGGGGFCFLAADAAATANATDAAAAAAWRRSGTHSLLLLLFEVGEFDVFHGLVLVLVSGDGVFGVELCATADARLAVAVDIIRVVRRLQQRYSISGMSLLVGSACFEVCLSYKPAVGLDAGRSREERHALCSWAEDHW